MAFGTLLNQTAILFQGTTVPDANGEEIVTWLVVGLFPCLIQPTRPYSFVKVGIQETITHKIFFPFVRSMISDPRFRWRIDTIGPNQQDTDRRTFVVVEAYDPGNRGHHLEIRARRLDEDLIFVIFPPGIASAEAFGVF